MSETHSAPPSGGEGQDEIDLSQLIDILRNGKWLIAAVTVAAGAAGFGYASLQTNIYQGDALIQLETQQRSLGGLEEMGGFPTEGPGVATQMEVLKSRSLLGRVVDELNLTVHAEPRYLPVIGEALAQRHGGDEPAPPRLGLEHFAWGGESIDVTRLEIGPGLRRDLDGDPLVLRAGEAGDYTLHVGEETIAQGEVDELLALEYGGQAGVTLFVADLQARPGTEFELGTRSRQAAIRSLRGQLSLSERGSDSGVLEVRMEHPDRAYIEDALSSLTEHYVRQHVERKSEEASRSLEFLEEQLPDIRQELETAEQQLSQFRSEHQAVDLDQDSRALLEQAVDIEQRLSELQVERNELELQYGPEHPRMETMRRREASLRDVKEDVEQEIANLPEKQQQALQLRREVDVTTSLYTNLLNTSQELRVARAGVVGDVFILDEAESASSPVAPQRNLIAALSVVLGGMLGVMGVFGREFLRRGISDPDALERDFGLPVYAVVPHAPEQRRMERRARSRRQSVQVLAHTQPQTPSAESLRSLRTSLTFALMRESRRILMITSPQANSGKTFVSVNLGALVAAGGSRVLVIDCDMRRGRLHRYLDDREREPGLSDILAGQTTLAEAARNVDGSELDLLTTGTLPPNPAELLMHERFGTLLEHAESHYDLVILDTAPVMAVADAAIVGTHVGATLMLARAEATGVREMRAAISRLEQASVQVSGLILNDFQAKRAGGGYYQYYYYDYTYRPQGT
ncbi:MAG: polysaccharide biosynthesis tyrosine autokinase [Halorhodospira halophila]|uniref:polysaccharide biosynthesis tyrosine autokinase n=1 Tax=Halorhodospira TaxID=85108 RepID=UPI001EE923E4|nr:MULTISPECIES: polysaccharide biosynthesis tyrosine autokinase [Halorhodospira]MCC3751868.1 polysaccharide biosynthesis tyrosine autokinase [Halorhodospira halophila]MCG5533610.1 polysaccharide biosynthesis tyrosine autokinase [Halorhodospira sp. 9621]